MKTTVLFLTMVLLFCQAPGQVSINKDSSLPDPAAILDLKSTTQGFLPPRLTTLQIWQITEPPAGLMVFNSDSNRLSLFDGTNWREILFGNCIPLPSAANAGTDQFLPSGDTAILNAEDPLIGHGLWTVLTGQGGAFSDPANPASLFWGPPVSNFTLRWTVSTGCGATFDDVNITFRNFDTIVYVSVLGDDANPGTMALPVRTIHQGITLSQASGKTRVNITAGNYSESVALASSVHLYGGYDSLTWVRDPVSYVTIVYGGSTAVSGVSVSGATIDGVTIHGSDATGTGGSAYGIYLANSSGIRIVSCPVIAGSGTQGTGGVQGSNGSIGAPGNYGQPGCENSSFLCETCSQPQGGAGAGASWGSYGGHGGSAGYNVDPGNYGQPGGGTGGGSPGVGGTWGNGSSCAGNKIPGYPANGGDGQPGMNGGNGAGGTSFGTMTSSGYSPSNAATGMAGMAGGGGGGGGGGMGGDDGCDSYGSGGGGGGSGGQQGSPGTGGTGGGGSFAVWCFTSQLEITGCILTTGNGGGGGGGAMGGTGGNGGYGAPGGPWTDGQDDAGCGGWGGNGGKGGNGGIGGGGGGGPTVGIVKDGSSTVVQTGNVFVLGTPGAGGASAGNNGQNGMQANTKF